MRTAAFAVMALLLAGANSVHAQTDEDLARARQLFAEGVQLLEAEDWDEAVTRFRGVMEIRQSGQVRYNLALALEGTGDLAEAADLLDEVLEDESLPRQMRRDARQMLSGLEPRLGRLTIHVQGDDDRAVITLDNERVGLDELGQPIIVDPGEHVIRLSRGGENVVTREIRVREGDEEEVTLVLVAAPRRAPGESSALPPPRLETEIPGLPEERGPQVPQQLDVAQQWWFWVAMGAIAVVIVTVIVAVAVSP